MSDSAARGGPIVLAIESSCDETAAAILDGPESLRASIVHTQIDLHATYGGVVPELASRSHVMAIADVVPRALAEAGVGMEDLTGVAVTAGPGLVGSLLVGVEYAKGVAISLDVPLVGVNHLEGHLRAPFLGVSDGFAPARWPFVGLAVSGGHTALYDCRAPGDYVELGRTVDDAAGEAYDKISKHLGLGYPGGAVIDGLATSGDPAAIAFPRPMLKKGGLNFSFSGLKTAVSQHIDASGRPDGAALADLCASFQEAVCEVLVTKTLRAADGLGYAHVALTGGVACNRRLRSLALEQAGARGISVSVPQPRFCTDNAAMIGIAGYGELSRRIDAGARFAEWALDARSSWPLGRAS